MMQYKISFLLKVYLILCFKLNGTQIYTDAHRQEKYFPFWTITRPADAAEAGI
jgi:hypothetical protein